LDFSSEIKLAKTIISSEEFNGIEIPNIAKEVKHIEIRKVIYILSIQFIYLN
jgi:hypothetical protein